MSGRGYVQGVEELATGCLAYMQPDGSWGRNNAGLVSDGGASLLVDTLFDLPLTRDMLKAFRDAEPSAERIGRVVNTHANGDHCWGNQLLDGAEIIASRKGADEMREFDPSNMAKLSGLARRTAGWTRRRAVLARVAGLLGNEKIRCVLEAAPYLNEIFGDFDFEGIRLVPPTRTFDGSLEIEVGAKKVELVEVGPAHTKGDILVWVPGDRVVFAGDILFIGGHPIMWEGPVDNWIAACDRIAELDAAVIVPGHGPLTDAEGVKQLRDYLTYVRDETRLRFEAGMTPAEATYDIAVGQFSHWHDAERLAVNVDTIYRELRGEGSRTSPLPCFVAMAQYAERTGCRR